MKRILQIGFLPLVALSVALGTSQAAFAKRKAPVAESAAPSTSSTSDAALFKHSDLAIDLFNIDHTARAKPAISKKLDCTKLPRRNDKTAWERGFDQGTSGERSSNRVTIGSKTIPELLPCQEYKAIGGDELDCCYASFTQGLTALSKYMAKYTEQPPTEPAALMCYEAFDVGAKAAKRTCDSVSCTGEDFVGLKLNTDFPGCMAMGFLQKFKKCSMKKSNRLPASSAFVGGMRDHRGPSKGKVDLIESFNAGIKSISGGAQFDDNHSPGAPCISGCAPDSSGWSNNGD